MNQLTDTHIHLYDAEYKDDLQEVIDRAKESGVNKCILPSIDSNYFRQLIDLSVKFPGFAYPTLGLHPTSVKNDWEKELEFVFENSKNIRYYAIGEIGMDGYWSKDFLHEQSVVFEKQIELASTLNLPVIIHSRDATEEILKVLERTKHLNISGVFHAFSGSIETFNRIIKLGNFKIGVGGVVTYKNASLANVVSKIDLKDVVLETDGPWLTPVPFRGKRNEPSYLSIIASRLAEIKGCSVEEISEKTSENAKILFNL